MREADGDLMDGGMGISRAAAGTPPPLTENSFVSRILKSSHDRACSHACDSFCLLFASGSGSGSGGGGGSGENDSRSDASDRRQYRRYTGRHRSSTGIRSSGR